MKLQLKKNKIKKEVYDYFDNFAKNIECSIECANLVYRMINEYDSNKAASILKKLHEIEHRADIGKHEMTNYLMHDFLPPIERNDILNLAQEIDNVTDLIEEIAINIDIFAIKEMREETLEFASLLKKCCKDVHELLKEFKNFKKNNDYKRLIIDINNLEEKGDKLYIKSMKKLYRDGTDSNDTFKWTTIYNCFENAYDMCEDLANDVENIIIQNL